MSLAIASFTYAAMVVLALSLLYLFGPLHWYWHATAIGIALTLEIIRMTATEAVVSQFFALGYGNLIVFLLVWGICAPFFRRHHMPPVHHF
jgi:hypothetical protein